MDVAAWLRGLGLEQYVPAFHDNQFEALGCDPETMGIVRQQPCFALGQNSRSVSRSVDRL